MPRTTKFIFIISLLFIQCSPLLLTQSEADNQVSASRRNAITRAVEKATPAVVGINVIEVRQYRDPFSNFFGDDQFFRHFFGNRSYQQEVKGLGLGFVISADGYILTNDHVAGNATQITVTMTNGEKYNAELIGSDAVTDVALLKINGKNFPFLSFGNSDDVAIGEWAIAFGNPFGLFENIDKPIITVGVISATGMNLRVDDSHSYRGLIQTDAVINSGNSGGPLMNAAGEVIGMNTLIYTAGVSQAYIGYGFAIPVNQIKTIVDDLKKSGKIERDFWTGIDIQPVDINIARYFGLTKAEGVIISDVKQGSPAEKAGLAVGDIITAVNDQKVLNQETIISLFRDARPGDTIRLKIYRERKTYDFKMLLERQPKRR